jgi:hypothetical protein
LYEEGWQSDTITIKHYRLSVAAVAAIFIYKKRRVFPGTYSSLEPYSFQRQLIFPVETYSSHWFDPSD